MDQHIYVPHAHPPPRALSSRRHLPQPPRATSTRPLFAPPPRATSSRHLLAKAARARQACYNTIVRVDGRDIDLAALPECSCAPFFVNYHQRRIQHNRTPQDVTEESVEEAPRIWREKEVACLFCRQRYWSGFTRMRQIALERQFQAQLPPELRLKRRRCLNIQQ